MKKRVRFCAQCIVKNGEKWNDGSEGLRYGDLTYPIGSMYGIYANIGGILMVNVTIYSIHGSYGYGKSSFLRRNIYKVL